MGYADLDEAARRLNIPTDEETPTAEQAALSLIDGAISALFDRAVGWDLATETREVAAGWPLFPWGSGTDVLHLPALVADVTAVEDGGTWDGDGWAGGLVLAAADYRLVYPETPFGGGAPRYRAIRRLDGGPWYGPVRITADWGAAAPEPVPDLVVAAVTTAVVREYRRVTSRPDGEINFDEESVPAPSGLTDPLWKRAVAVYAAPPALAV